MGGGVGHGIGGSFGIGSGFGMGSIIGMGTGAIVPHADGGAGSRRSDAVTAALDYALLYNNFIVEQHAAWMQFAGWRQVVQVAVQVRLCSACCRLPVTVTLSPTHSHSHALH
jgi:hypothetical protein